MTSSALSDSNQFTCDYLRMRKLVERSILVQMREREREKTELN